MKTRDRCKRTLKLLLALVAATSVVLAGNDDKDNGKKGGAKGGNQAEQHGGGKPAPKPAARGNEGGGKPEAKPAPRGHEGGGKPEAKPAPRGHEGGGKPEARPAPRGNQGNGRMPAGPAARGNQRNDLAPAPLAARAPQGVGRPGQPATRAIVGTRGPVVLPQARGSFAAGGRAGFRADGRGTAGGRIIGQPQGRSVVYVAPQSPAARAQFSAGVIVRGGPVFRQRAMVADPYVWNSGWHGNTVVVVNRPIVTVRTVPHYWRETMFVPVREPFVQMGCEVEFWDDGNGADLYYQDRQVIVERDSPEVVVVEQGIAYPTYWEEPPVVYEEQLYVPVRPAAVSLGLDVEGSTGGVTIGGGFFFAAMW